MNRESKPVACVVFMYRERNWRNSSGTNRWKANIHHFSIIKRRILKGAWFTSTYTHGFTGSTTNGSIRSGEERTAFVAEEKKLEWTNTQINLVQLFRYYRGRRGSEYTRLKPRSWKATVRRVLNPRGSPANSQPKIFAFLPAAPPGAALGRRREQRERERANQISIVFSGK